MSRFTIDKVSLLGR